MRRYQIEALPIEASPTGRMRQDDRVLTVEQCRDLAAVFVAHDYRVDEVVGLIGESAHRALGRNSTVPAVRAIGHRDDPLALLTLLWPLQRAVRRAALEAASCECYGVVRERFDGLLGVPAGE